MPHEDRPPMLPRLTMSPATPNTLACLWLALASCRHKCRCRMQTDPARRNGRGIDTAASGLLKIAASGKLAFKCVNIADV